MDNTKKMSFSNLIRYKLNDKSWSNNSYKKIFELNNLFDYNLLIDNISIQNLQNTMFF